jgi:hypothetical protein
MIKLKFTYDQSLGLINEIIKTVRIKINEYIYFYPSGRWLYDSLQAVQLEMITTFCQNYFLKSNHSNYIS